MQTIQFIGKNCVHGAVQLFTPMEQEIRIIFASADLNLKCYIYSKSDFLKIFYESRIFNFI